MNNACAPPFAFVMHILDQDAPDSDVLAFLSGLSSSCTAPYPGGIAGPMGRLAGGGDGPMAGGGDGPMGAGFGGCGPMTGPSDGAGDGDC